MKRSGVVVGLHVRPANLKTSFRGKSWLAFPPASISQEYGPQQVAHASVDGSIPVHRPAVLTGFSAFKKNVGITKRHCIHVLNSQRAEIYFLKRKSKEAGVPHMLGHQDAFISSSLLALIHPCCISNR